MIGLAKISFAWRLLIGLKIAQFEQRPLEAPRHRFTYILGLYKLSGCTPFRAFHKTHKLHRAVHRTQRIHIMNRQPINWDALEALPPTTSPVLDSGYISRVLLPLIEGRIRQVQAKCTICGKLFTPIAAHNYNKTSN